MRLLKLIPDNTQIPFMRWHRLMGVITLGLFVASIALVAIRGIPLGIDFSGGIVMEARAAAPVDLSLIRPLFTAHHYQDIALQQLDTPNDILIRLGAANAAANPGEAERLAQQLRQFITAELHMEVRKVDMVGPQVGRELIIGAVSALVLGLFSIMIYLWFRFEWQFGVGAIVSLLHDIVLTLGWMSLYHIEFNLTTLAALMTILGYSVNDTVVIYDRIRDMLRKYTTRPLPEILDESLNSTLSRTILTVLSTLLAVGALIIYGGEVVRGFSLTVFVGIVIGTYSSIYISTPLLHYLRLRGRRGDAEK